MADAVLSNSTSPSDLIDKPQIAAHVNISVRTLERWLRAGWPGFPKPVTPSRRFVRFSRAAVLAFLRGQAGEGRHDG
ncbi:MAG TPA: hypothetical protein VGF55_31015 [Gemmataceae bacterium]|jgi:predicted DNA-binding transcriptional regulator AlpA